MIDDKLKTVKRYIDDVAVPIEFRQTIPSVGHEIIIEVFIRGEVLPEATVDIETVLAGEKGDQRSVKCNFSSLLPGKDYYLKIYTAESGVLAKAHLYLFNKDAFTTDQTPAGNGGSLPTELNSLSDVTIAAPQHRQSLVYNNPANRWENSFITLTDVLAAGNTSGGTDISMDSGDRIVSSYAGSNSNVSDYSIYLASNNPGIGFLDTSSPSNVDGYAIFPDSAGGLFFSRVTTTTGQVVTLRLHPDGVSEFYGNVRSSGNNTYDLGATSNRWADSFFQGTMTLGASGSDYTLPTSRGTNNQVLQTDGSGVVTWETPFIVANEADNRVITSLGSGLGGNAEANLTFDGSHLTVGNFIFDGTQTVGAGQDNYALIYDDGTGLISLEPTSGFPVTNESNNRLLTSLGVGLGANAEANLTFDGSEFRISYDGSNYFTMSVASNGTTSFGVPGGTTATMTSGGSWDFGGNDLSDITSITGADGADLELYAPDNILINPTGGDITLTASVGGDVNIENLRINNDSLFGPSTSGFSFTGGSIDIEGDGEITWAGDGTMVLPSGPTSTATGAVRFDNGGTGLFEIYKSGWNAISGFPVTNEVDNRVITSSGTGTGNAEANLTFDGSTLTLTGDADIDNININGNSITSTDTNGDITLNPNGTGSNILQGEGTDSTVIGPGARAGGSSAIAIGDEAQADVSNVIAFGPSAGKTSGTVGASAMMFGNSAGGGAGVSDNIGADTILMGRSTRATNDYGMAFGHGARSTATRAGIINLSSTNETNSLANSFEIAINGSTQFKVGSTYGTGLVTGTSDPANGVDGCMYYKSDTDVIRAKVDGTWGDVVISNKTRNTSSPTLASSGGGETITYSTNEAVWYEVGDLVFLSVIINVATVSGGSGNLTMDIPSIPLPEEYMSVNFYYDDINLSANYYNVQGYWNASSRDPSISQVGDSNAPATVLFSGISAGSSIRFTIVYIKE